MKKTVHKKYKKKAMNTAQLDAVRRKLKVKHLETQKVFKEKYPHVEKYLKEKGTELGKVRQHSAKIIGAGALTGTLLLSPPTGAKVLPSPTDNLHKAKKEVVEKGLVSSQKLLVNAISKILPDAARPLSRDEEKHLESLFDKIIGVKARATLEGEHLNTTYGYIGAEQHLKRYPGDDIGEHGEGIMLKEGIAPGLGAWGHFSRTREALTPELEETEKWYAVVQPLYLPDWNTRQPHLRNWYKYRKVMIVNTTNGNAVVASIADAGPAAWTGKHFGGSPEEMYYLGGPRYKKGPVVLFFVDDPENKVPLGPVDFSSIELPSSSLIQI